MRKEITINEAIERYLNGDNNIVAVHETKLGYGMFISELRTLKNEDAKFFCEVEEEPMEVLTEEKVGEAILEDLEEVAEEIKAEPVDLLPEDVKYRLVDDEDEAALLNKILSPEEEKPAPKKRGRKPSTDKIDRSTMVGMWNDGWNTKELAQFFNASERAVIQVLQEEGLA